VLQHDRTALRRGAGKGGKVGAHQHPRRRLGGCTGTCATHGGYLRRFAHSATFVRCRSFLCGVVTLPQSNDSRYSRRKLAGIQRSLRKYTISRNRRNLQNRNSAAAEIAIRFGPKILLKCVSRKTGPKYPTIGLDYGYKSSFSLNHKFNHYDRAHWAPFVCKGGVIMIADLIFEDHPPR
jgi:hypothetical protein